MARARRKTLSEKGARLPRSASTVSYTHLDVYKRQGVRKALDAFLSWAEGVEREKWQAALKRAGGAWRPRPLGPLREVRDILGEPGC